MFISIKENIASVWKMKKNITVQPLKDPERRKYIF